MTCRAFALLLLLLAALPAAAQPTNAEVLARLAAGCLGGVPEGAFVLEAPVLPSYLRAPLVETWQAAGRRVFADTLATYPRLHLEAPRATVAYSRSGRRHYGRRVRLVLPYTLVAGGEVLRAGTCDEVAEDAIARSEVPRLEDPALPETIGTRPPPGWVGRFAEPVLLGGAVAVSTLLFFSLRSR